MAEEDEQSPFFGREYSEFEFTNTVYNFYIHPQWDDIGSRTLYAKILFVDYDMHVAIIELLGEWNDAIENDIQSLKRNLIDWLIPRGIHKFILIGESVFTFHSDDAAYYEEWTDDIREEGGWIAGLNFMEPTQRDFRQARLQQYIWFMQEDNWRTFNPLHLFELIDNRMLRLLDE